MAEKVLSYSRTRVAQETGYWCGPATLQNILDQRGVSRTESSLASRMGTTTNGTNHIGLLRDVLNADLNAAKYVVVSMPNDPPTSAQRDALWSNIVRSINAGYGVAVNIVSPPSNYPRAVSPSTVSPAYGGGVVYHYIAVMGYSDVGGRRYWIADSGFSPFGYWISHAQLATLIPPKGYAYATGGAATPTPQPSSQGMVADVLSQVMGGAVSMDRYRVLVPAFVEAMHAADITTVKRAAMWCAQLGHESGGLRWMEEIADGSAYEGRADLGNTQPGDGRRFKGRGPIQVTGRHNYTACSKWAHTRGLVPSPTYFVDHPEQLASDRYGFIGPVWYWIAARPHLNRLSDAGDIDGATKAINGGLNGIEDRRLRYRRALDMGARLLPTDGGFLMALSDAEQRELLNNTRVIVDQLGPKLPSWGEASSFGKDDQGRELTQRDGLIAKLNAILAKVSK
ncbi:C39 family peptidase [Gordonia malaquae]|uniref:C39 family peptidase n=1 Tax=Gordonia malaquae TaxID=410332 RepID=UPI0030FF37E4